MKKTILILALLVSAHCQAETVFYSINESGGRINLTDDAFDCPRVGNHQLKRAFAVHRDGSVFNGCWAYHNEYIVVRYTDLKETRMYDPNNFQFTDYGRQKAINRRNAK